MASYAVYVIVLLLCWFFGFCAEKSGERLFVWALVAILSILSGLRDFTVGIDTAAYFSSFDLISDGRSEYVYGMEDGFKFFCGAVLAVFDDNQFLLTVLALVTNSCILFRFWDFRRISSFSCMVSCYYMVFFFMTMNCIRQFCAVALLFYFSRYLVQKKLILYLVGVILASAFHQTAVIGLLLFVLYFFRWGSLSNGQRIFLLYSLLGIPALLYLCSSILQRYEYLLSNVVLDIGFMIAVKSAFLFATLFYVFVMRRPRNYFPRYQEMSESDRFSMTMASFGYYIGLVFAALGYVVPFLDRIGWYFYIFEGVYFGMLLKGGNSVTRLFFLYYIVLVLGYCFVYSMANNSQGTMPYLFFWQ